jgi:hypothetical protein
MPKHVVKESVNRHTIKQHADRDITCNTHIISHMKNPLLEHNTLLSAVIVSPYKVIAVTLFLRSAFIKSL